MKKFLVLDKEYADACEKLDFRTFLKQCTVVSSKEPGFTHEDAATYMAQRLEADGDLTEYTRWYVVLEEGQTRVADARAISVNSWQAGWSHYSETHGQYQRPRRRA